MPRSVSIFTFTLFVFFVLMCIGIIVSVGKWAYRNMEWLVATPIELWLVLIGGVGVLATLLVMFALWGEEDSMIG